MRKARSRGLACCGRREYCSRYETERISSECLNGNKASQLVDEMNLIPQSSPTMRLLRFLLILVGAGLSALAQTNAPEPRQMSLEDCIQVALKHNMDIQIKRYSPEISQLTLKAAYGAYEPLFSISGGHSYNIQPGGLDQQGRPYTGTETDANYLNSSFSGLLPWGLNYKLGGTMNDQYGTRPDVLLSSRLFFENASGNIGFLQLQQPLLKNAWIDNSRLQIYLDKKSIQSAELDVRYQIMTTITAVEVAYYDLIYGRESVEVQRRALELAQRLLAEDRKRVEVGALAPLSESQDQAQAASSQADLLSAESTAGTLQRVLKNLLSDDYAQWKNVAVQPTLRLIALPQQFSLSQSWQKGLSERPDLLQQQVNLEKQGHVVQYQKNQLFPQLDLVGGYGYNASSANLGNSLDQFAGRDNPFWSVGGQLSIPIGNKSARYNYRSAKASEAQVALQKKQLQQTVLIQIENAIAVAESDYQRVQATREARVYAEAALDAEQKKLENGKSTSYTVLQMQRDLTNARGNEIQAVANYNKALAQLSLVEGSTLERHGISVEVK